MNLHRDLYEMERDRFKAFIEELIRELAKIDPTIEGVTPKECIFRINRDIRFSKSKEPYKPRFAAAIALGGKKTNHGHYYIHLQPGDESVVAGGIYHPDPAARKQVREYIYTHPKQFQKILENPMFKKHFKVLQGEKLAKIPKEFAKIEKIPVQVQDWLKYKEMYVYVSFKDSEILKPNFEKKIMEFFKIIEPFNSFLNKSYSK